MTSHQYDIKHYTMNGYLEIVFNLKLYQSEAGTRLDVSRGPVTRCENINSLSVGNRKMLMLHWIPR